MRSEVVVSVEEEGVGAEEGGEEEEDEEAIHIGEVEDIDRVESPFRKSLSVIVSVCFLSESDANPRCGVVCAI